MCKVCFFGTGFRVRVCVLDSGFRAKTVSFTGLGLRSRACFFYWLWFCVRVLDFVLRDWLVSLAGLLPYSHGSHILL